MKVFKTLFPAMVLVTLAAGNLFASHYDYLTNLSAEWIASPNRFAVTDSADAATFNPAGTAFMKDGLYFNFSSQTIMNYYSAEVDSSYPSSFTESKSHKGSPFIPNMFVVFKQNDWSAFAAVNMVTGLGSFAYDNGLPSVNEKIRMAAIGGYYSGAGLTTQLVDFVNPATPADPANLNSPLKGAINSDMKGFGIAPSIGGAYKFDDMISASFGLRHVSQTKTSKATFVRGGANGIKVTLLEAEMKAQGITPIIGVDIKPDSKLNIGLSFEAPTKLEYEVNIKTDLSNGQIVSKAGGKPDGAKYRYDLPGKFNIGAEYAITDNFKIMASGIYYLSKWMKMEKNDAAGNRIELKQKTHSYEIGAGFEWKFMQNVAWTGGVVWDYINQPEEQTSDELFKNDCLNVGTGLSINPNDKTKFTIGFMRNFYPDLKRNGGAEAYPNTPVAKTYDETYHKESWVVAVGMEHNFM